MVLSDFAKQKFQNFKKDIEIFEIWKQNAFRALAGKERQIANPDSIEGRVEPVLNV